MTKHFSLSLVARFVPLAAGIALLAPLVAAAQLNPMQAVPYTDALNGQCAIEVSPSTIAPGQSATLYLNSNVDTNSGPQLQAWGWTNPTQYISGAGDINRAVVNPSSSNCGGTCAQGLMETVSPPQSVTITYSGDYQAPAYYNSETIPFSCSVPITVATLPTATLTANGVHDLTVYPPVGINSLNYNYTLAYSSTNASSCTLSFGRTDGDLPTTGSNAVAVNGSAQTGLIGSYTLTCVDAAGNQAADTDIITAAYPSCSISFAQNPYSGASTVMNWTSSNDSTMYISNVGYVSSSGSATVSSPGNYSGTATSPAGTTAACSAALTQTPPTSTGPSTPSSPGSCPDGSAAPEGNPSNCTCAQGNTSACNTGGGGTCPDGSAAPNGDPSQCTCAQGNTSACNTGGGGTCPDGSPAPGGNTGECSCAQGNQSACNGGGGGGGTCPAGEYSENGSCVAACSSGEYSENGVCVASCSTGYTQQGEQCVLTSCPLGYQQESGQCVFTSCPQGYTEQTGPTGTPECSVNTCSVGPICSNGNAYIQNADCSLSNEQVCSWGCSNGQCLLPPPPSIATWQVKPVLLQSGQTTTVTWQATDVASCSVTGSNGDSWTGDSGTKTSSPITGQTVYTILCQGEPGSTPPSATDSTTVNIVPNFCETGAPGCP